jgi:hypothetical protein
MVKDALYKAAKIRKLAARIRDEEASGHEVSCPCPVCQATFFIQRTMLFLENSIKAAKSPLRG